MWGKFILKINIEDSIATMLAYLILATVLVLLSGISHANTMLNNLNYSGWLFVFLIYSLLPLVLWKLTDKPIANAILNTSLRISKVTETTFGILISYWIIQYFTWLIKSESINSRIYSFTFLLISFFIITKLILAFFETEIEKNNIREEDTSSTSIQYILGITVILFAIIAFIYFGYINWDEVSKSFK